MNKNKGLLSDLSFSHKDDFFIDDIIDYSKIPISFVMQWPRQLAKYGICDDISLMVYFADNKMLMPIIIMLQQFNVTIHLANRHIFEEQIRNIGDDYCFISDILYENRFIVHEINLLNKAIYIYCNKNKREGHKKLHDIKFVFYTSGTTGDENKIIRTQKKLIDEAYGIINSLNFCEKDIILCNAPVFHSYGQAFGCFAACLAKCKVKYLPSFLIPSHILKELEKNSYTILISTPYYYNMIYDQLDKSNELRYMLSAGGKLSRDVISSGIKINNVYGTTETGAISIQQYKNGGTCASVGTPIDGVKILLGKYVYNEHGVSIYEIYVDSKYIYDYRVKKNKVEAYIGHEFYLGDIGYIDQNGNLFIYGRNDSVINLNGEKISLHEIETVLLSHPYVENVKVVACEKNSVPYYIEAYIVLSKNNNCTKQELRQYIRSRLDFHKIPRFIHIVESLEITETGKILNKQGYKNNT